jgi:hypothetical protein
MLEAMTPQEFDERWQANILDPIDDSWRQTSLLAAVIVNKLEQVACRFSGKRPQESDCVEADKFVPHYGTKPKRQRRELTPEEMLAQWQSLVRSR